MCRNYRYNRNAPVNRNTNKLTLNMEFLYAEYHKVGVKKHIHPLIGNSVSWLLLFFNSFLHISYQLLDINRVIIFLTIVIFYFCYPLALDCNYSPNTCIFGAFYKAFRIIIIRYAFCLLYCNKRNFCVTSIIPIESPSWNRTPFI